jgi:hypothetical protein
MPPGGIDRDDICAPPLPARSFVGVWRSNGQDSIGSHQFSSNLTFFFPYGQRVVEARAVLVSIRIARRGIPMDMVPEPAGDCGGRVPVYHRCQPALQPATLLGSGGGREFRIQEETYLF